MAITHDEQVEHWKPQEVKIINDKAVRFRDVCVHEIRMGDVEDPDLFVADPIYKWQQSDAGTFIMENAVDKPYWTRSTDYTNYGHLYRIVARLSEQNEIFWQLKWGDNK